MSLREAKLIAFVATRDPATSRKFYEGTLGFQLLSDEGFALVFDAHGTMLRIQKVDKLTPHGFTTLGWQVADIRKEAAELKKRGVQFNRYDGMAQDELGIWPSPAGAKVAWFNDPDGNVLSLTEF